MEQTLQNTYTVTILFLILVIWEMVWKGIAMWKSARSGEKYWFVAILVINTVGILPIIYLLYKKYYKKKS